jgi:hypothetical protein
LMMPCGSTAPGITTLDFAKAMIDEGYHPMTVLLSPRRAWRHADPSRPNRNLREQLSIASSSSLRMLAAAARGGEGDTLP